jgi:hypothetical protein
MAGDLRSEEERGDGSWTTSSRTAVSQRGAEMRATVDTVSLEAGDVVGGAKLE